MPRSRRIARRLLLASLGLALGLAAVELGQRVLLRLRGKPYDASALVRDLQAASQTLAGALPPGAAIDDKEDWAVLEPYVGADTWRGTDELLKFFADEHRPPSVSVLVLGGSVAYALAAEMRTFATARLNGDPRIGQRRFCVLDGTHYGFKQPQQVTKLAYLLARGLRPDVVLEVDGFNELALAMGNLDYHSDPLLPIPPLWGSRVSTIEGLSADASARIGEAWILRQEIRSLAALARRWSWSSVAGALLAGRIAGLQARIHELERQYVGTPELEPGSRRFREVHGPPPPAVRGQALQLCLTDWEECSLSMAAMCRARGIVYLHVLQPTLWDRGSKPLTAHELELDAREISWTEPVRVGYPELRKRGAELREQGVEFLDASRIFADVHEELYYDHCHILAPGNQRLWLAIEPRLLEMLQPVLAAREKK
jgi:hypothetical protein